jgi:putative hemolysin
MGTIAFELLIIIVLVVANGVLAMAEMSIVSARKARLQQRANEGDSGAAAALDLANEPEDLLSTIQIGITLIGVLAGAFGGATLAGELSSALNRIPVLVPYSEAMSVAIVVVAITYLTLVIGELAPKQIALYNAEQVASRIAQPMTWSSRVLAPVARLLSLSAQGVLRLLRVKPGSEPPVTEEEIKILLDQGREAGVFEPLEEEMVDHVFRLGDRKVSALLTPRTEVVWIDVDDAEEEIRNKIMESGFSRFPVAKASLDNVLGVALAKDLLAQTLAGEAIGVEETLRPVPFVPENMPALDVLERFKAAQAKIALVLDEYGGIQGLVTTDDVLDAIVGDIPDLGEAAVAEVLQREDGSWLVDGYLPLDEFRELFEVEGLPISGIDTVGGLAMALLGRIPSAGDKFRWQGLAFEVMDMDGLRVDKVLVKPSAFPSP